MLFEDILKPLGSSAFKGQSDAHDRLLAYIEKSLGSSTPKESRAIIFCIAYTMYSQAKKRAIKEYMNVHEDASAKNAHISLCSSENLASYCDAARSLLATTSQNITVDLLDRVAARVALDVGKARDDVLTTLNRDPAYVADINTIKTVLQNKYPDDTRSKNRKRLENFIAFGKHAAKDAVAILVAALILLVTSKLLDFVAPFISATPQFLWENGIKYFKYLFADK